MPTCGNADKHYRKPDGQPTRQLELVRLDMRPLRELYGRAVAADFGPLALKAVRPRMIDQGTLCRLTINENVSKLKRMFAWGVENELVPSSVFHGLQALKGLQAGRTEAKGHPPVRPVPAPRSQLATVRRPRAKSMPTIRSSRRPATRACNG